MARLSLDNWIRECLTDKHKEGGPTMFALVFQHSSGREIELSNVKFPSKGAQIDPLELATMFGNKAEAYCQDMAGVHSFQLLAFWGGSNDPQERQPFTRRGKMHHDGAIEAPDESGERNQRMRHKEVSFMQYAQQRGEVDQFSLSLMGQYRDLLKELGSQVVLARRNENEALGLFKEMMLDRIKENNEFELKKLELLTKTREREKWLGMAAPLANTLMGTEVFPQEKADKDLVDSIADHISKIPGALEKIVASGAIPAEVVPLLAQRFKKRLDEREQQEKNVERLLPKTTDPEADAAGDVQPNE